MRHFINEFLYFQVNSLDEEDAKQEYKSKIADIDNQFISLQIPINIETGKPKKLEAGDEIYAYFITDGGVKNFFMTTVTGFKEEVTRLVLIKKPSASAITKVQRRNYLRVPADLEISVSLSNVLKFISVTEDVSGGGVSFGYDSHLPLETGKLVTCWMIIPCRNGKIEHVSFLGVIVRIKASEQKRSLAMVKFTEISDRDRQILIRYCFERQLEFRKE